MLSNRLIKQLIHWVMTLVVLALLCSGYLMTNLDDRNALKWWLYENHRSIGVLAWLLLIFRLVFLVLSKQFFDSVHNEQLTWMKRLVWAALYLLMFLIPLTGYLQSSPYGVNFFGFSLPVMRGEFYIAGVAFYWHQVFTKIILLVIAGHLVGFFLGHNTSHNISRISSLGGNNGQTK